jgi:serine/threonine-protein kinase
MQDHDRLALRILRDALDEPLQHRRDFVARRCCGDAALLARVNRMLAAAEEMTRGFDSAGGSVDAADSFPDALIGSRLGAWTVVERIGRGGMGVVYKAERDSADFRQVAALKLIRRGFDFEEVHARFLRERRILAQLSHPNLARFIDGGVTEDGRPWFALEHVQGDTLTRWSDARRLDIRARMRLLLEACAAVQYAHTQLVVHRDLKPANILVDGEGKVRLLDFGIARLLSDTQAGEPDSTSTSGIVPLTPAYASPEQLAGSFSGVAGDVYALGMIAYELISGVLPYDVDPRDPLAMRHAVQQTLPQALAQAIARPERKSGPASAVEPATRPWTEGDVLPASPTAEADARPGLHRRLHARSLSMRQFAATVRGDLARIVETALDREPQRRYATVAAFADDLQRWLDGEPVHASGNSLAYRARKFVVRNRWAVITASILACGLLASSVLALRSASLEREQREFAVAELERSHAVREYVMLMFRTAAEQGDPTRLSPRDILKQSADQLLARFQDSDNGPTTALMLAELYMMLGDAEGAAPLLQRLTAADANYAEQDVRASAEYDYAQIQYHRGMAEQSAVLLASAQRYWQDAPGTNHARLLNESRMLQAQLERASGQTNAALETLRGAIGERRDRLHIRDRELAILLATEASIRVQAGQNQAAFDSADEACRLLAELGMQRTTVGLGALNNRAQALMMLDRRDEAQADFRSVVESNRTLFGPSLQLATAQNNLAMSMPKEDHAAEVIGLLEEALAMAVKFSGEQGRATLMPRTNLAEAYVSAQRIDEAETLAEAAVKIAGESFNGDALYAGTSHRARARVRLARGDLDGARIDIDAARRSFTAMGPGGSRYLASLAELRAEQD